MEEEKNTVWPYAAAFVLHKLYKLRKNSRFINEQQSPFYYYEEE
tara:strand:+ start:454 stop:585 length:132 start_codon:yes stop_codon:yes gene_type:complete